MSRKRKKKRKPKKHSAQQQALESKAKGGGKVLGVIGIIIGAIALVVSIIATWDTIKKYVPFFPKPLIRISYQITENNLAIVFDNMGNAPASYFTVDITTEYGSYEVKEIHSDFELTASGKGGSWTVISGKDMLPQQKGAVILQVRSGKAKLNPPKVKSDSRYKFVGSLKMTWGPEESVEDYKKKQQEVETTVKEEKKE